MIYKSLACILVSLMLSSCCNKLDLVNQVVAPDGVTDEQVVGHEYDCSFVMIRYVGKSITKVLHVDDLKCKR